MKKRIPGSVLSLALLSLLAACEKEAPTNGPATTPEPARSLEQNPAVMPTPGETAVQAQTLAVKVVTGSPEGFLVTSTLVTGEKDAVLIDAQFTLADAKKVADAVTESGKNLTTVLVTHSHPDHYFGFPALKERFPNVRLMALPAVIAEIEKTWQAKVKQWQAQYKDAITSKPLIPEPLATNSLDLEGRKLEIFGAQQGDSADNTYVWIPSLRTVVTGDIVYDDVYPWTAETTPDTRKAWISTLERIAALQPEKVVPGHQKAEKKLDPSSLTFTKNYLTAYDEALASSKSASELQAKLKAKYPEVALDVVLKIGAEASFQKPGTKAQPNEKADPTSKTPASDTTRTEPRTPQTGTTGTTGSTP